MKILILGDASNPHIIKWANGLKSIGIDVIIFSIERFSKRDFTEGIQIYGTKWFTNIKLKKNGSFAKILYLVSIYQIKSIINQSKPDILHAHYASSYGLLGALVGFRPLIISVWGGDVISFPTVSSLHSAVFRFNLSKADKILTTSRYLSNLLKKYTPKDIDITPFGIDTSIFRPDSKLNLFHDNASIVIGTVKGLEWYYGIEYLIEAFQLVLKRLPQKKLKLLIVGGGALEKKIKDLIKELNLEEHVLLTGKKKYHEIQKYHNSIDIFVAVSVYQESFGVAVIEASACEKPVIISRVGGMVEVVEENVTGFVVSPKNSIETAEKIIELVLNKSLRVGMGKAGRKFVEQHFSFKSSLTKMISIYKQVLKQH